jgi:hypothetical protein
MADSSFQWFGYLECPQYSTSVYEVNEVNFLLIANITRRMDRYNNALVTIGRTADSL